MGAKEKAGHIVHLSPDLFACAPLMYVLMSEFCDVNRDDCDQKGREKILTTEMVPLRSLLYCPTELNWCQYRMKQAAVKKTDVVRCFVYLGCYLS